jgi:hypothetical protein
LKKKTHIGYLSLLLIGPIILLVLDANFFDKGQSICLSVLLLDKSCFGCGMTRAVQHLIHFDFNKAYYFNKLSFIVLPLLIFVWYKEVLNVYKKLKL